MNRFLVRNNDILVTPKTHENMGSVKMLTLRAFINRIYK